MLSSWIKTLPRLGFNNLFSVAAYRLLLKYRLHPAQKLKGHILHGKFFKEKKSSNQYGSPSNPKFNLFGWYELALDETPPAWNYDLINDKLYNNFRTEWWKKENSSEVYDDIKIIWELSRFDWLPSMAIQVEKGSYEYIKILNNWINDWIKNNPPYLGPNWLCAQEASIRIIHIAQCSIILGQSDDNSKYLNHLISLHMKRIYVTIKYGIAQNNNHGLLEAVALFVGGSWLLKNSDFSNEAKKYLNHGRKWVEDRVSNLIDIDGTFSQYSVNYHRLALDSICFVELWRKKMAQKNFSNEFYKKAKLATEWIIPMVQTENGNTPNIGANDGANLLHSTFSYNDYRPTVQLASILFKGEIFCNSKKIDHSLKILGVKYFPKKTSKPESLISKNGGFASIISNDSKLYFRFPKFKFRPSESDSLHVDFWIKGENVLRDGGTFSYHCDEKLRDYFAGNKSHNTIEFDDRNSMPRLSNFLYGNWLKTLELDWSLESEFQWIKAGYIDYMHSMHIRKVEIDKSKLKIVDSISNFKKYAILRWRLKPGEWTPTKNGFNNKDYNIIINSTDKFKIDLVNGFESKKYLQKTILPVLEVKVDKPTIIETELTWKDDSH